MVKHNIIFIFIFYFSIDSINNMKMKNSLLKKLKTSLILLKILNTIYIYLNKDHISRAE